MRVRTWSACVALAWGIVLLLTVTAAGSSGPFRPAQANTRIAGSTSSTSNTSTTTTPVTLTSSVTTTRTDTGARAAAGPGRYVVQPGDTLSGIAAATGVPGGWPALYAANRRAIGPDPGLIRPGTALALPGRAAPASYVVQPGDTLSGIAAAAGVPGGWPVLYAANRRVIGPDPDAIRAGTVLAIPHPAPRVSHPASSASHAPSPASTRTSAPTSAQPSASATAPATARAPAPVPSGSLKRPTHQTAQAKAPAAGGLPRWLEIVLIAAGLLIATAFLIEPILAIARRRRAARPAPGDAHIVLADYERLVVTHSRHDGTVYVLRPPDADPHAILLAARLVLAQDRYEALAGHLGIPAHWPRE
jgi:LysM repeat protein